MPNAFDWTELLANLRSGTVSLAEYAAAIKAGDLADRDAFSGGDEEFQSEYPAHPQGSVNRGRRIAAADSIRDELLTNPGAVNDKRLAVLHDSLFDCSGAVREAMVVTLAFLARSESLPSLRKLQALEVRDSVQSEYIAEAIEVIEGRSQFKDGKKLRVWLK